MPTSRGQASNGIEQLRSRGNGSVGRHQGGIVVARSIDVCWFGTLRNLKSKWTAVQHMHSFDQTRCWTQEAHRFENLVASRLDCCGRCGLKKIPRTQNLADMLTHTPSAKELEVFLPLMGLWCCSEREKELVVNETVQASPDQKGDEKVYSHSSSER